MPRPSDWDAIGLGEDPTPGEPETVGQLAEALQGLGGKAREIFTAIESVMNTNNDGVFVGAAADALRGKVDERLRGHVEDVANAFETSAQALRDWRGVVEEQQRRADSALSAGRGLAVDDPERDRLKTLATQAGQEQSDQAPAYAGRINGVSDIRLPISECDVVWQAFQWLAIILIIPALIFGGPIALLALGVNLALFIKTIVDVAHGDASFLDLFIAGLGLIAPTTKALPIFGIAKGIAKGIAAGAKGFANAVRTVFSKDFLFNGLLAGLKAMPMLAGIAIRETGLFVVSNIRTFAIATGNFVGNFGEIAIGAFSAFKTGVAAFRPGAILAGFERAGAGFVRFSTQFLKAHLGGLQWTRIFLPVAADDIRAFKALGMSDFQAFTKALKVGVIGRGVLAKNVYGLPTVSAIGRGISASPIDTAATAGGKGGFLHQLLHPEVRIPSMHINNLSLATEDGFSAGKAFTAIDELHLAPMNDLGSANLGISVHTPTTVTTGGVHVPATAGTPGNLATNFPSPHVGQSSVAGITSLHVAVPQSTSISDLVSSGLRSNSPVISSHFASSIGEGTSHGFQASHLRLSIDEIVNLPTPSAHGATHSLSAPTADRVNAALDLLTGGPVDVKLGTPVQPITVATSDVPIHPMTVHAAGGPGPAIPKVPGHESSALGMRGSTPSPGRAEIPLTGLPDHPGAVVTVERFDGGAVQFNLHGGGPNGRLDPLNGGAVRFTDTSNGTTTRFSSNGILTDQGVRLTKADGLPRIDDRVLVRQADGDFRITNLDGNLVPDHLTVHQLDAGGVQLTGTDGTLWHYDAHGKLTNQAGASTRTSDLAAAAGVFHKPGDTNAAVNVTSGDLAPVRRGHGDAAIAHENIAVRAEGVDGRGRGVDVPLAGIPDRPGVFVRIEERGPTVAAYELFGGGQDGRLDVLPGESVRFTDSATGQTFRFDGEGRLLDTGVRLTQRDGVLRLDDRVVVVQADGSMRVTTLAGDGVPEQLGVSALDDGGIQVTATDSVSWSYGSDGRLQSQSVGAVWERDLAERAAVFRRPGDSDAVVHARMDDFGKVRRAEADLAAVQAGLDLDGSAGPSSRSLGRGESGLDVASAQQRVDELRAGFAAEHGVGVDDYQSVLDHLMATSVQDRPRVVGAGPDRVRRSTRVPPPENRLGQQQVWSLTYGSSHPKAGGSSVAVDLGPGVRTPGFYGSAPKAEHNTAVNDLNAAVVAGGGKSEWIKGHLWNDNLGGPGTSENLTPMTRRANAQYAHQVERPLKNALDAARRYHEYGIRNDADFWLGVRLKVDKVGQAFPGGSAAELAVGRRLNITTTWLRRPRDGSAVVELSEAALAALPKIPDDLPVLPNGWFDPVTGGWEPAGTRTSTQVMSDDNSDVSSLTSLGDVSMSSAEPVQESRSDLIQQAHDGDVSAHMSVFRLPDDSDAAVRARMEDFKVVQSAHSDHVAARWDPRGSNVRGEGSSTQHPIGDQVNVELLRTKHEWEGAKETFEAKHGMSVDQIFQELENLRAASVIERPRILGSGTSQFGQLPGERIGITLADRQISLDGPAANSFTSELTSDGLVVVRRMNPDGTTADSWIFQQSPQDGKLTQIAASPPPPGHGNEHLDTLPPPMASEQRFRPADSGLVKDRPRPVAGGGLVKTYDVPGHPGITFEVRGKTITLHGDGAEHFETQATGSTLTVRKVATDGTALHSWTYNLGFGGRVNHVGESRALVGGAFDGRPVNLEGKMGDFASGHVVGHDGTRWPVRIGDDALTVASPQGALVYEKGNGAFRTAEPGVSAQLPTPIPPPHLNGDDLTRWNAQADLSRTHLSEAASNKAVEDLMKDVMGGAFTSKRGFEGYVNPTALADGTLVGKVKNFDTVTKDLLFKGPADNITVYRGVSIDPISAQADEFLERLPISTSSTLKFQDEWAKNGVNSNRVVFEIDVPPVHGKLAMSYPDGYHWEGQARPWNQDQWEITLAPTKLLRTGPDRFEGDLRIIPVKAEQIPAAQFEAVITAKWPGMSSDSAFNDFAKSFETANLQNFDGLEDIATRATTSVDGLSHTIHVSKPGSTDELTITVLRDPQADSVRVIWTADGVNKFDKTWSGQQFANLATDLRGNVLHNNDQFLSMPKPAAWDQVVSKGKHVGTAWEDDFAGVQQAQRNFDLAHENVTIHGERIDGPSNAPSVGDQVHLDLHGAQHDLDLAKNAFEGKHGLSVDGIQKQLDDITTDSLNVRPRLLGAGRAMTYDVPGHAGLRFDVNGGQVSVHGPGSDDFTSSVVGKTLTISGNGHTWTYSLGFGGRANQVGESFRLQGGLFDGKLVVLDGKLGDLDGRAVDGQWSVKVAGDGIVVVSPHGPLTYSRSGEFHGVGATATGDMPRPVPPPHLAGDDLVRWNAQVDLSRTHLTEAAANKTVEGLMKDVMGGSFTSKRGYGGYVNPTALADGTLVAKVKNFDTVAKDLQFKGPADHITVYRGVSMDPIAAQADEFIERLPISTSSTLKFQDDWAKNGVDSNRVVFKVDVPPNHGKLAMSYPEGYHPGGGEVRAWNQDQWEITLGPAKFTRTGPDIFESGHRIIPVKAEPIPASAFDEVITAKWPGLSSEAAFGDFVKSFETSNLRGFEGLEDITTRATTSVDGLSHTVHVGKPGSVDELTITVLRDPQTDSVRVIWTADGANQFDKTWLGQDFSNLATDLRGNVLHNNDQFLGMPKPASWDQTHTAPPPPPPPPTVATHGRLLSEYLPSRSRRLVAPEFGKTFDEASFGTESELGGLVVAMPEGSHRVFAFVKQVDTSEPLVMVAKDMRNDLYRNPGDLPVARNGSWTTHTVELVSYPSRLGDQAAIAVRDDASQFLLDTFKSRLTGANHQPLESITSADGRFRLEITNTRHVIAGGSGTRLDDFGLVSMPLSGQQVTVGVKATEFGGGATNELRLLRDNRWYDVEFRNDDAVRNLDHAGLDNPEAVESAYAYLKSIISFTAKQVDKHGIPIGDYPGVSPFHSLTDPAVKNDWGVLPRTRPNMVLAGLSDVDRAATLKLLRDMPSIGDGAIWRESTLYILGGGEVAGHGINDAVIGGEKALLFEFRTVPNDLKHLVPTQKPPAVSIIDLLADLGQGRAAAVRNINGFIGHADNSGDFAGWFRDKFPNHVAKTDQRVVTISTVQQKAEWMMAHKPNAWDQVLAGQEPVIVQTVQLPQIQQHPLGGAFDNHTVVRPEGGTTHVTGPNAHQFRVFDLPDGGFRVVGARGQMQRFDGDGVHLTDGVILRDPFNVQETRFAEGNGTSGFRATDLNGVQLPHTRVEQLRDGTFRVSHDAVGEVRWFDRSGIHRGSGIRVADPAHPGQVFLYRAHGMDPALVDDAGVRLPGTVETVDGGGFWITEANGPARTFDDAGIYLDRRIPLGGNQTIIHNADNHIVLNDPAGTTATVQHVPGGGYRVVDSGNYRRYDNDGVFQANGHQVNLPGESGFLEITAIGARRLDGTFQPIPGRSVTFDGAAGEITVTRTGGFDVFDRNGVVLREVTELDGHALGVVGGRITRNQNGGITWTGADGSAMRTPYRPDIDANGVIRLDIHSPGSPRHGEFHVFGRDGHLTRQGFPVVRNGHPTGFTYVVNRTDNSWERVGGTTVGGAFHRGRADAAGLANGRIKLMSSTGKPVEVFERRWLPDGSILDSFRRTDTLGFGWLDRRTGWVTYDESGALTNSGTRHFDTTGSGWRDLDRSYHPVREYRDGLQKYQGGVGHVLATKRSDGSWRWYRYDDRASLIAQGDRMLERIGDGWTDTVTRPAGAGHETMVAQQKWGVWHLPETAGQYREYMITRGADGVMARDDTWLQQARHGKESGSAVKLGDELLTATRQGEQRPPVRIRESGVLDDPRPVGIAAHLADDSRFQIFTWSKGQNSGVRYVATDGAAVDVDANGVFVRSSGTLGDGTKIKVGDHARSPQTQHPDGDLAWEAGADRGWRIADGQGWQDVKQVNGEWVMVREARPGGVVREYPDPSIRTLWSERDVHGNLTGLSSRSLERDGVFVEATGLVGSAHWTWQEIDANGIAIGGRGGEREFFRGSWDESLSWDDSFRDFDAAGNLLRDRRMLNSGRYVEAWWTPAGWRSAEFDRFANRVAGSVDLERLWSTGEGGWHSEWIKGAVYSRDQLPAVDGAAAQVVRETPLHRAAGPIRIREYLLDNGVAHYGRWKEFDHGTVVRERKLSGENFLETEAWRGQWKLYDRRGNLLGERSDNGLVFELRDGKLHLTGNEYDFRGPLTELRGWGRRVREEQRMPWLTEADWVVRGSTIIPPGEAAFREARYVPAWQVIAQKALLEFGQDIILELTANLIVNAIVAASQNKPFTGRDALKALMNAAVSSTVKTGVWTALIETKLGGSLRELKLGLANIDSGKNVNRRPANHDKTWTNDWAGNETATRWRGGTFAFGFNLGSSVLAGFVNATMNAAVFGVSDADGHKVRLTGWKAVGDGGLSATASLTSGVSTALVKNLVTGLAGSRLFHRQGFGDFWLQLPFRVFEKSIQGAFLTNAYRFSIDPSWYQVPGGTPSGLWVPPDLGGAQ